MTSKQTGRAGRPQMAAVCLVLAALGVSGGVFALFGFAAGVMTGGTALTHVMGFAGAAVCAVAGVTLIGTTLSPHDELDLVRAGRALLVLIPAVAALSLALLVVILSD